MSQKIVDRFIKMYGKLPTENDSRYLELLNMSKYRILDRPMIKPAKCANCGAHKEDGRKYIDFGLDIDWFGIVYLCTLCLKDIALNSGVFDDFRTQIIQLEAKVATLQSVRNEGENIANHITELRKELEYYDASLRTIRNDSASGSVSVLGYDPQSANSSTSEPDKNATDSDQRITESSSGTGRENLSSPSDLLNF